MACGQKTKTENRSNVVANSINTLNMVHIKKKSLKNKIKQKTALAAAFLSVCMCMCVPGRGRR